MESCRLRNLPVAVFCEAGAGRTGTMIGCYLIHSGQTAAQAIAQLRVKESSAVETPAQIKFLEEFEKHSAKMDSTAQFSLLLADSAPILALAPMQDVTDLPFWKLMAAYGGAMFITGIFSRSFNVASGEVDSRFHH